jgi:fructokinase
MTTAGSGQLAQFGDDRPSAGNTARLGAGHILVLGECLVDLAPVPPAAVDATTGGAGGTPTEGAGGIPAGAPPVARPGSAGAPSQTPSARYQPRQRFVAMPGGGPANIAVGLARLEVPSAFAGRFSRSGFGPWLRQNLVDNGVDLSYSVDADEPATIALVTLDSQGRASYTFYGPTTADWQWKAGELPGPARQYPGRPLLSAVHTGSLVLALGPGADAISRWLLNLREQGQVLISLDPNVRPGLAGDPSAYRERLTTAIRSSHIVKASNEDVGSLYPGTAPGAVAEKWLSLGVALVVITEGPDGATGYHRSGATKHCRPPPVEVADTIGAGDAFTSGLLAYFSEHSLLVPSGIAGLTEAQLRSALAQAVAAGTLTCTRPGADPPNRPELAQFLDETG